MTVRNKLFAWLLVFAMMLSMTSGDAFAAEVNEPETVIDVADGLESEENTDLEPNVDQEQNVDSEENSELVVCICTDKCNQDAVNADCPVCSAEGAQIDSVCLGNEDGDLVTPDEPTSEDNESADDDNSEDNPADNPVENQQETPVETSEELRSLQEQINTLPTGEEYRNMSADEQDAVYEMAASVSDAYIELSEEDQAKIDITRLEELFAVLNEGIETYGGTGTVTFLNSGYPYGKNMGRSAITLVIEVEGSASSYQWQVADSKNGTFADLADATANTYTFTPTSGSWYRCVVDGTASEAVMAVYPGQDGRTWTKPYSSWYISNGAMAYMANGTYFDAVGLYTKNGINYMLCTSYGTKWDLFSDTSATPTSGTSTSASLDALRVSFDASDDYNIFFEVDLADGYQAFSFGCDTQLGSSATSGNYSDRAALNAMVKNGVLQQVAMIGASTVKGAADTDPSFVIAPIDLASAFWIGNFSSRKTYAYNTSGGTATETVGGQDGVVTLVENTDSGMTMSWMNIPSGGTVRFRFSVGDVAHTGAVSGKVDYQNEKLVGLEPNTEYVITSGDDTYTVTSDSDGAIPLSGKDMDGKDYDFVGKTLTVAKKDSDDAPAEIEVVDRPTTPDNPSDLEKEEGTTPTLDANIEIVELTTTSVTIAPKEGQQYAYSADSTNWTTLTGINENGNYVINGLAEGSTVYIRTRVAATSSAPASQWSNPTEVKLKSTVKVAVTGWHGTYDKAEHSITLKVNNPAGGATVAYSSAADGSYSADNPSFVTAGEHIVFYRVTAPNYYPAYGSVTVRIDPKEVALEWSNTELTYNGSVQTPMATVKADSLYGGDICAVNVAGGQKDYRESAYIATATGLSNPNYKLPAVVTQAFTIAQKELEFQWGSTNMTYNGKTQTPTATLRENLEGLKLEVTGGGQNVGTYSAIVALTGTNAPNCKLKGTDTVEFEIHPKKLTTAMVSATTAYTHTGSDITPAVTVKDGEHILSNVTEYTLSGDTSAKDVKNDYTVTVTGTGNYTGSVDVTYKITDSQVPTGTIKVSANEWKELVNSLSFGIFYKERQTVTITAEDEGSGVDKVFYFLTSSVTPMSEGTLAALPDSKWKEIKNGGSFTINPDNKYVIYAKITDKSGNVTYISSNGLILDKTAPAITGIQNNKTYCADVTFAVADEIGLASVKIDDMEQGTGGSYSIAATGVKAAHTIVAEDVAGNKTTYTITINANGSHSPTVLTEEKDATCTEKGSISYACPDCGWVETQEIPALGHNYKADEDKDAHIVWTPTTSDGVVTVYTAKAYFICTRDPGHAKEVNCTVTRTVEREASTEQEGTVKYTAVVHYNGTDFHASRTATLEKLTKLSDPEASALNSNIYTSTSVAEKAPETTIGSELDATLAKNLLTEAEKADYESTNVSTDVTVYLEVQNINGAVASGDALKVESQIADLVTESANTTADVEVKTGAAYLDLSMYKNVKTEEKDGSDNVISESNTTTQITDTGTEITITMAIPRETEGIPLVAEGFTRTYNVIRVHDGNAEVLPTTRNGDQLTFRTSKFSTYAVTYVDVKDTSVTPPSESSGSGSAGIPVTKVTISSDKSSLTKKGDTLQLTVDFTPSNATDKKISWSSSDPSIATVDENGKVTAVGNGTVTITAKTSNGKAATFTVVVDLVSEKEEEKSEAADTEEKVTLDTTFRKLNLAEAKATKDTVKVSWKQVADADGYVIYGAPCNTKDKTYKIKKIAVIKNGSKITYTNKKLKSGTYYKYYIKAYKLVNGKKVWLAQSKVIHVTTSGGKYGNAKAVKVNKTKVTLKKGKSLVIKASQIAENKPIKQHVNIKFESSNTKIATVTKNGRIKAKKKGTCYIYVYAQNGVYKRIKIVVS